MNTKREQERTVSSQHRGRVIQGVLGVGISSAALNVLCLSFAIGVYDRSLFYGYFRYPLIFLLNWLPILLLQVLLLAVFNRHWLAFLVTCSTFLTASIGNFFKLKFRDEPFVFRDIGSVRAGLSVAGSYGISLNRRIIFSIIIILLITILLAIFCKQRLKSLQRVAMVFGIVMASYPLWKSVYSNSDLYYKLGEKNQVMTTWDARQYFTANGFVYPFLFSITESRDIPPEGYDAAAAEALMSLYNDETIPEDKKSNILVLQMESLTDLEAMGAKNISEEVYKPLRLLQKESLCGTLIANVIGGGTIDTERCVLTGSYGLQSYRGDSPSYIRYLNSQGYFTSGGHPNRGYFYNRSNVAKYLGFQEFLSTDNYYQEITGGAWRCDESFLPDVFRQFLEYSKEKQAVCDFRISLQGHGPYNSESYDRERDLWRSDNASDTTRHVVNNYLSMITETQKLLLNGLNTLRDEPEPMIVLIYGDHNPYLSSEQVYQELGITFDMSTEEGFLDYYGTPWLIWANEAAKAFYGKTFSGNGPTVSPGYLLNVLFQELGWRGSAFMQFTDTVMKRLPVVSTNGYYIENGEYTLSPSKAGEELLTEYRTVQFWIKENYTKLH